MPFLYYNFNGILRIQVATEYKVSRKANRKSISERVERRIKNKEKWEKYKKK